MANRGKINHMLVSVSLVSSATSRVIWAFAVSAYFNVNELGDSYNTDTGIQDNAEINGKYFFW